MAFLQAAVKWLVVLGGLWLLCELVMRSYLERPLRTDFYGSLPREAVPGRQEQVGVRVAAGMGWAHLGWIADPLHETYWIERRQGDGWQAVGRARYGSFLVRQGGVYRVVAERLDGGALRVIGEVPAEPQPGVAPLCVPRQNGPWRKLFRPQKHGYYINDHCVYRDGQGRWRLVGITDKSDGSYSNEKYFAVGVGDSLASGEMEEQEPVADFGELAWAPHVIVEAGTYYMFWSPHRLHRMLSSDGIAWRDHRVVMTAPMHKFFRDAMVLKAAPGQWLLYTTARGAYFSQVDVYQSFDLETWQYICTALRSSWGSERNSPFASTESPFVIEYQGRYYLSITYNNDSFFWPGVLMTFRIWPKRASYNDTLVFQSDNPYDFGVYCGKRASPTLLTTLRAHAPEYVHDAERDVWYMTTAGWPWVATLTSGEVAIAPLRWEEVA